MRETGLLSLVLLAASAGCQQPAEAPETRERAEAGNALVLAMLEPSADTDMAALEGFLQAEGRCLYVRGHDHAGGRALPAFAIPDVQWDPARKALHVRGKSFAEGQRITLTGGTPTQPAALKWVQRPDPSCDASHLFVTGAIDASPQSSGR